MPRLRQLLSDIKLFLTRIPKVYVERGYTPSKALLITAHPDDPEYFCAGTMALWATNGTEVRYVICTSGQAGFRDRSITPSEIGEIREKEQLAAAKVAGVKEVIFLRQMDGFLENNADLRKQIVREIRRFSPDVVVTLDPTLYYGRDFINHPDHRAAGAAALDAVYPSARTPHLFQDLEAEGLRPHAVDKIYIFTWQRPNTWIDITDTISTKVEALKQHKSQLEVSDPAESILSAAARSARFTGLRYAETYYVISL